MIGKLILGWVLKRWVWVAAFAALSAWTGGIWVSGYRAAWKQAEVETLKATIASQKRDLDANAIVRKADQNAITQLEAQAAEDDAQNEALRCALAQRPADAPRGLTQSELDLLLGHTPPHQHRSSDDQPAGPADCPPAGGGEATPTR